MKILMQGRVDLNDIGGGDKVQIEQTASELRLLRDDIVVDISTSLHTDYTNYDLIHIFQLDWTPETYLYAKKAAKQNKPIVISPIHHSVVEVAKFDELYAFGFRRLSRMFFTNQFSRDTLKNIYRSLFNYKKFYPTVISIILGLQNMQRKALKLSTVVLVQTNLEANDLISTYGVAIDAQVVPNGVGKAYIQAKEFKNHLSFENYVFCVGRIEARKNQLHIIQAVKNLRDAQDLDLQLVFAGPKNSKHHIEYVQIFEKLCAKYPWIHYLGSVPYENMPSYFHFAKVGVSASWFETSGLTSLEALYCGTNPVASGERAKEYLGDFAYYCQPEDINSISDAILKAYNAPRPIIPDDLKIQYTWETAAKKTLAVYERVLNK